jgi:hypothetical protein
VSKLFVLINREWTQINAVHPVKSSRGRLPKVAFNRAGTDNLSSPALKSGGKQMMSFFVKNRNITLIISLI